MCSAVGPPAGGPDSKVHEYATAFCDPADVHETVNPTTLQPTTAIGGGGVGEGVTTGGGGVGVGGSGVGVGAVEGAGVGRAVAGGSVAGREVAAGADVGTAVGTGVPGASVRAGVGAGAADGADEVDDAEGPADGVAGGVGEASGETVLAAVSDESGPGGGVTMAGNRESSIASRTSPRGICGRTTAATRTSTLAPTRSTAGSRRSRRRGST